MAFVRATVTVPEYAAAALGHTADLIRQAESFAREVKGQLPVADTSRLLTLEVYDTLAVQDADTISTVKTIKNGAAAGNVTVTGVLTTDVLESVWKVHNIATDAGPPTITDLTSEFTITAADTINNTAGTSSAGDCLLVTYRRVTVV